MTSRMMMANTTIRAMNTPARNPRFPGNSNAQIAIVPIAPI
jgi:hypothetical protein